jgi:hypothetical protein
MHTISYAGQGAAGVPCAAGDANRAGASGNHARSTALVEVRQISSFIDYTNTHPIEDITEQSATARREGCGAHTVVRGTRRQLSGFQPSLEFRSWRRNSRSEEAGSEDECREGFEHHGSGCSGGINKN